MDSIPWTCVAAAAVTFNPDAEVFDRLQAVAAQVPRLYVAENGSDPAFKKKLAELAALHRWTVIDMPVNLGVGAALNAAAARARADGFAWLLTLDDDTLAPPGLVEMMRRDLADLPAADRAAVLAAGPVDVDSGYRFRRSSDPMGSAPRPVVSAITSGSLFNLVALAELGPFREDFYLDYIDHEYCLRATAAGWGVFESRRATIAHRLGRTRRRMILGRVVFHTLHSPSRRYYVLRNRLFVCRAHWRGHPRWVAAELARSARDLFKTLLWEDHKLERMRMYGLAVLHFLRGRTGPLCPGRPDR